MEKNVTEKAAGYVTEIPYPLLYHPVLNPVQQHFALLSNGVIAPDVNEPYAYLELGCGPGLSLVAHAAANPHAEFFGVDLNPEHIALARGMAREAGLRNLTMMEKSFAELRPKDFPKVHFISAQGVWSWVNKANRDRIKKLVDALLRPAGVLFMSYNCLPEAASMMAMRDLMRMKAASTQSSVIARIQGGVALLESLRAAKANFFELHTRNSGRVDDIKAKPQGYVAHEYLNANFDAFYHYAVAAEFAEMGLHFGGSAHIGDNIENVNYAPEALAVLNAATDGMERETLKDFFSSRTFRQDLFTRSAEVVVFSAAMQQYASVRLAPAILPENLKDYVLVTLRGSLKPKGAVLQNIMDALASGSATPEELSRRPPLMGQEPISFQEGVRILVAMGAVMPALPEAHEDSRRAQTDRLNGVLLARAGKGGDVPGLVSPVSGSIIGLNFLELAFIAARREHQDPVQRAWDALKGRNQRMIREGKTLESDAENLEEIESLYELFVQKRLPVFRALAFAE